MTKHREDSVRTSTNGQNFHGMVRGAVKRDHGATNVTQAHPGGSRAGGMTPASWQGKDKNGKDLSKSSRMSNGYPTSGGWIGWDN